MINFPTCLYLQAVLIYAVQLYQRLAILVCVLRCLNNETNPESAIFIWNTQWSRMVIFIISDFMR